MLRFLYNALWTRNVQIVFQHRILAQCFRQVPVLLSHGQESEMKLIMFISLHLFDLGFIYFKFLKNSCTLFKCTCTCSMDQLFYLIFLNNTFQFIIKALSQSCISTFQNDENINKTYIGVYESFFIITT